MARTVITLDDIQTALNLPDFDAAEAHRHMMPGTRALYPPQPENTRKAGVLVLLYPYAGELHFVLTRRAETLRGHSGQISFPGGKRDSTDPSLTYTALRETCEELGICDESITILGQLTRIYIPPSNFEVYPTVAALGYVPVFRPNPDEVAEVYTVPVSALLEARYKQREHWTLQGERMLIPYYAFQQQKVWGATAIMLSELENRLRQVIPELP